jgi:hypothetical protein
MLISATKRNGFAKEEPQKVVTQKFAIYVGAIEPECSVFELLSNA